MTDTEIMQDPAVYPGEEALNRSESYLERSEEFYEWLNRVWSELSGP